MGSAMVAGLLRGRPDLAEHCIISDMVPAASAAVAADLGGRVGGVLDVAGCDVVVLAVKPNDVPAALSEIGSAHADGSGVLISVAAGWTLDRLVAEIPGWAIVRTMPNLAVRHGVGVIGLQTAGCTPSQDDGIDALLAPLGAVVRVPEKLFPAITALAGSGPGFVALVAEGLEEGAVGCGISRADARQMVQAVLAGSAALLADGRDPALLRQQVSSPGGTTIAGLAELERGAVRSHLADAVRAAAARAAEL